MQSIPIVFMVLIAVPGSEPAADSPLIYDRFETANATRDEGSLDLSPHVVSYGVLGVSNTQSAHFQGQTCLDYGKSKRILSTDFTVESFVNLSRGWAYQAIAADWLEDNDHRSWALVVTPQRAIRFDISPDGAFHAGNKLVTAPRLLQVGTWYHIAAVSEGGVSRIFINGRKVAEKERAAAGIFADNDANLKIGDVDGYATNAPKPFFGYLDEVRITARALSPAEFIQTEVPMPDVVGPTPESFEVPFAAKTQKEAMTWQMRARAKLIELVESQEPRIPPDQLPLDIAQDDGEDRGGYTVYEITFQGNRPGIRIPAKLCVPEGRGPFPAMLCLHGHSGSAEKVLDPDSSYHAFADRAARGGYVVLAPSLPHRPYAALTLWNLFRCVDILAARPEVDADRIGVGGLSMGGEWTMWIAACDPRLKVAVVSGWMCTTEGVFSVPNCSCWELPGLVELMDICEVNLLIAPRNVVFESAEGDNCFPVRATQEGFARIQAGYRVFGNEHAARHDVFPGVHEWHGTVAFPVVNRVLGGNATMPEMKRSPK